MANNTEQKLMSDFPAIATKQWEEVITKDLKGADYQRRLIWKTAEGFNVRPYYRAENLEGIKYLAANIGEFPYVRSICGSNNWRICQTVCANEPSNANQIAITAIEGGAEMINFIVTSDVSKEQIDTLLKNIDLEKIELSFMGGKIGKIATLVIDKANQMNINPDNLRVTFGIDPIITRFTLQGTFGCSKDGSKQYDKVKELSEKGAKYKNLRLLNVAGENFHNSGSTIVQELAFSLAVGHEYIVNLMERGLNIDQAANTIRFTMAVGANYFMEIAKFRAARMLWANIVRQYSPECNCAMRMKVHAVTSKWNLTAYDPYVNMLRATTEAMSAAIATVQSLEVTPFNAAYQCPTEFSSRIARNVQLLLKHEAHFHDVVDPAGGSYYIENLTNSIAQEAWKLFKQVESEGGYVEAFKSGFVQDTIENTAARRDMDIATRREILLGTNQYPNFGEKAVKEITSEIISNGPCTTNADLCGCGGECDCGEEQSECDCKQSAIRCLKPYRGAMAFEQMRLRADRRESQPKAFMLTCGTLNMARARAQFAGNFFGCAGIKIIDNNFFDDIQKGIKEAIASRAEIIVVCAADDDYATIAPQVMKGLEGKAIMVIAGAPASQPELEKAGIRNFISVKSNVLESLEWYLNQLGI